MVKGEGTLDQQIKTSPPRPPLHEMERGTRRPVRERGRVKVEKTLVYGEEDFDNL